MSLTEEDKMRLLPDLRMQSRIKYMDKREKDILEKERAVLKDEK